jgi:DNA modification methylase
MEIKPYDKNAKIHTDEQLELLAKVVKEVGWRQSIEVNMDGVIVAGHGRWMAYEKYGEQYDLPEPWIIDGTGKTVKGEHATEPMTAEQEEMWRLADNQINALTGVDMKIVVPILEEMSVPMLNLTGFDLAAIDKPEPNADNAPSTPKEAKSKPGDLYTLGDRHRVLCGDATSLDDMEKLFDGYKADLWLTDPPYNVDYTGKTKDALKIENDEMSDGDFRTFLRDAYTAADAFMKPGAVFYIWHADSEGYNFRGAAHDIGWQVRQCLIWNKNTMVMGRQDYHWKHEPCLYGWKEGDAHLWNSDRTQTTILEFARPSRSDKHPTMKPVDLLCYQMTNNTKQEDIVLDSFLGSGSTLIAAQKVGRVCFGLELDPKYVDVVVQRYVDYMHEKGEPVEVYKNGFIDETWQPSGD